MEGGVLKAIKSDLGLGDLGWFVQYKGTRLVSTGDNSDVTVPHL